MEGETLFHVLSPILRLPPLKVPWAIQKHTAPEILALSFSYRMFTNQMCCSSAAKPCIDYIEKHIILNFSFSVQFKGCTCFELLI